MKKSFFEIFALLLMLTAFASGCIKENIPSVDAGGNVKMTISTKSIIGQSTEGVTVSNIRIMVLRGSQVIFNKSTDNGLAENGGAQPGESKFDITLDPGSYTVCVVGNETSQMKVALNAAQNMTALQEISTSTVADQQTMPLFEMKNVTVQASTPGAYTAKVSTDNGATWNTALDMPLKRLHTKVSFHVRKNTASPSDVVKIRKVEIVRLPDKSYMIQRSYTPSSFVTVTTYDSADGITLTDNVTDTAPLAANYTQVFDSGNIFPEKYLNSPADSDNAAIMRIHADYNGSPTTYSIVLRGSPAAENYNLLRNIHYVIKATVTSKGEIESPSIVVQPLTWEGEDVDVDVRSPYLNISEISSNVIYGGESVRIHYWTNQSSAYIENNMIYFTDTDGDRTIPVSDVFSQLSGEGAANNHFDTKVDGNNYTGYIEIMLSPQYTPAGLSNLYRLTLNAGGMKREISVDVSNNQELQPTHFGYSPWVGTFHRWNQVGERIIAARHSGAWSATVMNDPSNSDDFVRIATSPSTDPKVGSDSPGDAEMHLVKDVDGYQFAEAGRTITGNGNIYFRVGLTSRLSSVKSKPRYARIQVNITGVGGAAETYYIYVRQGEADDYLYEPGQQAGQYVDNDGTVSSSYTRTAKETRKYSVYNLSVARPTAGGPNLNDHYLFGPTERGVFVDFPTKMGWYFSWNFAGSSPWYSTQNSFGNGDPNYRRAFHPYNPGYASGANINGFPGGSDQFSRFRYSEANDPCPYGYELPSKQMFQESVFRSFAAQQASSSGDGAGWVVGQQDRDNLLNYTWGYYADGFFDRRPTRNLPKVGSDVFYRRYQIAGYGSDVAFVGALFYNHDNTRNNSLFIPASGSRIATSALPGGHLIAVGGRAYYMLSSQRAGVQDASGYIHTLSFGDEINLPDNELQPQTHSYQFMITESAGVSAAMATPVRCVKKLDNSAQQPVVSVVRFDLNRGSGTTPPDIIIREGESRTATIPTLSGITPPSGYNEVAGWNTRPDATGAAISPGTYTAPSSGVTVIYATYR